MCNRIYAGGVTARASRGGLVGYTSRMGEREDEVMLLQEVDVLCERLSKLRPHLEDFGSGPVQTTYKHLQAELDIACGKLAKLWA